MDSVPAELIAFFEAGIPFNRHLGIRVDEARRGIARLRLPFREEFIGDPTRPALHGGVLSTLIDACGGLCAWTEVSLDDRISTIDLRVDYLAPAGPTELVAEAEVVRVGNRVAVVDIRCTQDGRVVATGKAVYNIKRKGD
jgi:uncharacterized protein (TIGR00369 family)